MPFAFLTSNAVLPFNKDNTLQNSPRNHVFQIYSVRRRSSLLAALDRPQQPTSAPIEPGTHTSSSKPAVQDHILMVLIGLTASTVGSLIGAGGGVLLTPLLTSYGLSQHKAHGTSLCVITVTAAMSAFKYATASQINFFAACALTLTAVITSPLGAKQSATINAPQLKRYFGVFLLVVSCIIPAMPYITHHLPPVSLPILSQRTLLAAVGAITGFLTGLLGIGGGTINVPVLVLFAGFSQKLAQGTSMLAMLIPSLRASYTHIKLSQVAISLLPGLALGAIAGGTLGSSIALILPENILRFVCSAIFFSIGVRYLRQGSKSTWKNRQVDMKEQND